MSKTHKPAPEAYKPRVEDNRTGADVRAFRALEQFKATMRKNPGVFTTSLRDALQLAVIRLAVRGRNPTKFERQFVATASYGLERGFGAEHKAHLLQPHRIPPAPGSFAG